MANKPNPTAYHAHAHFNAHSLYMYYIVWRFEAAALHADFYATRTLARLIATSTNKIRAHPPQSENKNGPKRKKKTVFRFKIARATLPTLQEKSIRKSCHSYSFCFHNFIT